MNIRKYAYFFLTKLKRAPVIDFIKEFHLDQPEKDTLSQARLNRLIKHANENTQFYAPYDTFDKFPVISKDTLRESYDQFLIKNLDKDNSIKTITSGSTGKPMTFYLSKNKKYRQNAEAIFYNNWGNIDIGDYHAYVRIALEKSKLTLFLQNEYLMKPKRLTDDWLETQVKKFGEKKLTGIIGYVSPIVAIAKKAIEMNYSPKDFNITGIITTGEGLKDADYTVIQNAFGPQPISRYSTEEFGVLATMCPVCGKFHLNDTGHIIEVLDLEEDRHVDVGETGRVVVTDLFSDNMPLIRFDTGDIAEYGGKSQCRFYKTGKVLNSLEGRLIETIYDVHGHKVPGFSINSPLRDFKSIKQFQFIQNTLEDNTLLIVTDNTFNDEDESLLTKRISNVLGVAPNIQQVDDIPASKTGKRPYILSYWNK